MSEFVAQKTHVAFHLRFAEWIRSITVPVAELSAEVDEQFLIGEVFSRKDSEALKTILHVLARNTVTKQRGRVRTAPRSDATELS